MDTTYEIDTPLFSGPPVSLISGMPGGVIFFCGDAALWPLASEMIGWRLAQSERVLFLDGDNCFNPYPITNLAKRIGHDPRLFLSSIFISRAATCHQMTTLITRQLGIGIARHCPRLVLLAEPLATFYDEAVSFTERKTLLSRAVSTLVRQAREGTWIVVLTSPSPLRTSRRRSFQWCATRPIGSSPSAPMRNRSSSAKRVLQLHRHTGPGGANGPHPLHLHAVDRAGTERLAVVSPGVAQGGSAIFRRAFSRGEIPCRFRQLRLEELAV
ncbi:MAG: hypothetical protein MPW17_11810 [Candidatus Manganitrophus sp.]|nr:MAG: hypothetical protein MPW17_11810 [Candidatus Manganitrophus sp.]